MMTGDDRQKFCVHCPYDIVHFTRIHLVHHLEPRVVESLKFKLL
jgi:hypothetical protein